MYEIVRWSFKNLHTPMVQDTRSGKMYCTTKQLCEALGVNKKSLHMLVKRHVDEFEFLRVTKSGPKEFLKLNKIELGIERISSGTILWSEDDMIMVAILSKSSVSREFRKEVLQLIRTEARKSYVTREEHDRLKMTLGQVVLELEQLKRIAGIRKQHVGLSLVN